MGWFSDSLDNREKGTPGGSLPDNTRTPRRTPQDYGMRHGWYETPENIPEGEVRAAWDDAGIGSSLQNSFGGDFDSYRDYQIAMLARESAGLGDHDTYNKAVELHKMSIRGADGPQSEWERNLRDTYRDATNSMYSRAQASGRNRAAVARAYESGIMQQDSVMERNIGAMRAEESKIAGDALTNLLYQARVAGAEGAAAEAELLQQWQHAKDQERMDMIANVIGGLSSLAGAVIV